MDKPINQGSIKNMSIAEAINTIPEVKELVEQLQRGEISICACMGPVYDEPYCPCQMKMHGLESSAQHVAAIEESNRQLQELFGPGGDYYQKDKE